MTRSDAQGLPASPPHSQASGHYRRGERALKKEKMALEKNPTPGLLLLLARSYTWPAPSPNVLLLLDCSYSWPAPLLLLACC